MVICGSIHSVQSLVLLGGDRSLRASKTFAVPARPDGAKRDEESESRSGRANLFGHPTQPRDPRTLAKRSH